MYPQVWDTNSLVPVCTFGLPDRVFALDMSQVAAVHCLIAVGSAEPQVRLSSSCLCSPAGVCCASRQCKRLSSPPSDIQEACSTGSLMGAGEAV